MSLILLCFPVLGIAQSSLNSQVLVLPRSPCPDFWCTLPQLICSSRARVRLRTHYLTFLPRISFSKVLVVSHCITCACQTALDRENCLWGLQEKPGKKCKLSYSTAGILFASVYLRNCSRMAGGYKRFCRAHLCKNTQELAQAGMWFGLVHQSACATKCKILLMGSTYHSCQWHLSLAKI